MTTGIHKQWAREHYRPGESIDGYWHPVIREECARMNAEARGETMPRTLTAGAELKKRKDRG